ncbi:MAG: nitroreductase family protein [Ekhidna sp.]|nr:nitroreductase family protein [Ekhidna sp.]MBC6410697.1 nitroreductase family protein [Ekhidna sp.]MBC6426786.1 nitroreductase family protein [Ekhidna sp.]
MNKKEINGHTHIQYQRDTYELKEAELRAKEYYEWLDTRRTVRDISDKPVSKQLIENLIMAGSTAPSGAHKQPWTFCAVSGSETKKAIRAAAEKEEYESYHGRMSKRWLDDLKSIGTDWKKPFLEEAPWLVIIFKKVYEIIEGEKRNNYYVNESVGIACGMIISAIHRAGLVTLTHTPSPMNFLTSILGRPENERPYLLLPIGYPKDEVYVPDLNRKSLDEVAAFYEQ